MKRTISLISTLLLAVSASGADWAPAGESIKTPWAAEVTPGNVLPEYPRPQMVRSEWMNLNGLWDYAVTDAGASGFSAEGKILVPFCIESSLSGVGKSVGRENALWYERSFTVPRSWKGREVLLHFGAVDWKSEVWVNGKPAGVHTGGYTPFTYNITPLLKKSGVQTIRVKVWDATDNSYQPRGKQICESRGIWYTPVTGIWQTVWIEPVAAAHIDSYYVVPDVELGTIEVSVDASGLADGDKVEFSLIGGGIGYDPCNPGSDVLARAELVDGKAVIDVPGMKLWSPDSPWLYGLKVSVVRSGKVIDSIDGYTSFRSIKAVTRKPEDRNCNTYRRMELNGEPLFQFGPLDQGWWPDGLYTAPTDEALRFDIAKTREWGFNMIRKHIKVEPARWYWWCDVLGVIVWQDMPSIGDNGHRAYRDDDIEKNNRNVWSMDSFIGGTDCTVPHTWKENYYKEWGEIISCLKNFQCICVWIPFNEGWGQFDTPEVVAFTRKLDPTRLVNESSGGNYSLSGDILDAHHYACPAMNVFEKTMVNVIGEYGGLGYPIPGHLWKDSNNWGYGKTFDNAADVMEMYERFAEMLKVFISTGCSAAVYTQTTDVEIEVNGLMTYDRMEKYDAARLNRINTSVIGSMKE